MNDDLDIDAAEYALGTLAPEARAAFERRLTTDAALAQSVERWRARLAPLAAATPGIAPPRDLWRRIAAATIDADAGLPGGRTVLRGSGAWSRIAPGVDVQVLAVDRARGFRTMLIRMAAGSTLPAHPHAQDEECLMLEGEIRIGELPLRAGDWHLAPSGQVHAEIRSTSGALLYVRASLDEHAH